MDYADPPPFTLTAQGQVLTFYPGGADRLAALLGLIDRAERSIRMMFYIFSEDASGAQVRDALARAARRGVRVNLIVDGFGADARKPFFADMCAAGAQFCCFSPRWSHRYLIRNHQKLVVVDNAVAMLGGFNVQDSYFAAAPEEGWNDLGMTIEGPAVNELSRWFDQLDAWTGDPQASWRRFRRMIRSWQPGTGGVQVLIGGPTRGLSTWVRRVRADLTRGQQLDMAMAYFSPSNPAMRAIGGLARRGVVRLVFPSRSDNAATVGATRSLYDYLLKRRARIWEFEPARLHTKLIVIDDVTYVGSANFDMRSLYLNLELMLRIEDAALAARMRELIDGMIAASTPITASLHKQRAGLLTRIRWNLSWFLVAVVDYTVSRRLNLGL